MQIHMQATPDCVVMARDVAATVQEGKETERHARAVLRYREEREFSAPIEGGPWWIDLGGEGEPQ